MEVSKILQTCDGAFYTPYAVTRGSDGEFYNSNERFAKRFNVVGMDAELSLK